MLGNLNDYVEMPEQDVFKVGRMADLESEISENCQQMMSKIQRELHNKGNYQVFEFYLII
jgi:hypothetical protein